MAGGEVDAGWCWPEWRYCGFRLGPGLRCALRHIDDDLYIIVRVVCFYRIVDGATRRCCLRGLVVGVYTWRRFPFRGDTRWVTAV